MIFLAGSMISYMLLILSVVGMLTGVFSRNKLVFALGGLALIVYFCIHYYFGYVKLWMILITLMGLVLFVLEVFIPSFGLLGTLAIACFSVGIVSSAVTITMGWISLALILLTAFVLLLFLVQKYGWEPIFHKIILKEIVHAPEQTDYKLALVLGLEGKTLTALRPSGKAIFEGEKVDVITKGGYISEERRVVIVETNGVKVVVKEIK